MFVTNYTTDTKAQNVINVSISVNVGITRLNAYKIEDQYQKLIDLKRLNSKHYCKLLNTLIYLNNFGYFLNNVRFWMF